MATAKLYEINTPALELKKKTIAGLKGQALVVWNAMVEAAAPVLAKDLAEVVKPNLVTRQDHYRVTLYYVLIFKGKGLVRAVEPAVEVEPDEVEPPTVEELEETIAAS